MFDQFDRQSSEPYYLHQNSFEIAVFAQQPDLKFEEPIEDYWKFIKVVQRRPCDDLDEAEDDCEENRDFEQIEAFG